MDTETMALRIWHHWSERVCDLLGDEWGEDDTEITLALLGLFKAGKTSEEAVAQIRRGKYVLAGMGLPLVATDD